MARRGLCVGYGFAGAWAMAASGYRLMYSTTRLDIDITVRQWAGFWKLEAKDYDHTWRLLHFVLSCLA